MAKILVVGSINMDLVVRVPRPPAPGETILGGDFQTFPGGKGANQAVAAARLGGEVTLVGRVGHDDFGYELVQGLADNRVNTNHVVKDPGSKSGIAMITVADNGENSIVVAPGANTLLSKDTILKHRKLIQKADLLLVQLECPLLTVTLAIELAHAYKVPVVLNPAPAQPLPESLLAKVTVLTPNESELALLSGENDLEQGIKTLRSRGVKSVVVTLGAQGARLVSETADLLLPSFKVAPVDTTAAGDAFNGALAVMLAEGKPLPEAVRYGTAAGALATTKIGAQPSLPTRYAVEQLLVDAQLNP
ncbi:MAG: ribokinase [Chloroflexi bacterium]|nr:ribokinase [Chloroflexota bacterium]